MGFKKLNNDVEYDAEEGIVKLILRRPVPLYVPTDVKDSYDPLAPAELPDSKLELSWVYGYLGGRGGRNNLWLLASGHVVYYTAATAVIYDTEEKTQRHYCGHTDDISSLCVHPEGVIVATGQVKGKCKVNDQPHVRVWDSDSLETLYVIGVEIFQRAVACLAFSKDGSQMAIVDNGPEPQIYLWTGEDLTAQAKASSQEVLTVIFSNEDEESRIVTIGKGEIGFWNMEEDQLNKKKGIFGDFDLPRYVTAIACTPNQEVITGDSNGNLFIWEKGGNTINRDKAGAHEGTIYCIYVTEDGNILTGGKDGKVIEWDSSLEPTGREAKLEDTQGRPRSAVLLGENLVVGTSQNALCMGTFGDPLAVVAQGHLGELWGMATHPSDPQFITAGQDGMVYVRDCFSHEVIWERNMEVALQSAAFTTDGQLYIVGTVNGTWIVIDPTESDPVFTETNGEEPIQVLQFSPDGSYLAVGSRDNNIYLYNVLDDFKSYEQRGILTGHSSYVTHIDWSEDGQVLRSNSGDYEALFWSVLECSQLTDSSEQRDNEWSSYTCTLAFSTLGIWAKGVDGTDVNACVKANEKDLLVSADDFGKVKLFKFPCCYYCADNRSYQGHSSHVTNASFLYDDSNLLTAGGRDNAVLQWKVEEIEEVEE